MTIQSFKIRLLKDSKRILMRYLFQVWLAPCYKNGSIKSYTDLIILVFSKTCQQCEINIERASFIHKWKELYVALDPNKRGNKVINLIVQNNIKQSVTK